MQRENPIQLQSYEAVPESLSVSVLPMIAIAALPAVKRKIWTFSVKRLAILCQHRRVDREQDKEIVSLKHIDQQPTGNFQADRHGLAVQALPEGIIKVINSVGTIGRADP